MSDIDAIRDELADRLSGIYINGGNLTVGKWFQDMVNPPCAVIGEGDPFIDYTQTLEGGTSFNFRVIVYASRATEQAGQAILDELRDSVGAGSVPAAIQESWVGESAAYYATVHSVGPVNAYTIGQIDYLGAEFVVEVVAS